MYPAAHGQHGPIAGQGPAASRPTMVAVQRRGGDARGRPNGDGRRRRGALGAHGPVAHVTAAPTRCRQGHRAAGRRQDQGLSQRALPGGPGCQGAGAGGERSAPGVGEPRRHPGGSGSNEGCRSQVGRGGQVGWGGWGGGGWGGDRDGAGNAHGQEGTGRPPAPRHTHQPAWTSSGHHFQSWAKLGYPGWGTPVWLGSICWLSAKGS